ncbi:hypothetical protein D9M71_393720 [compost metagenome]
MVGVALHCDLLPGNALEVLDHANQGVPGFQNRPLLDVQFEVLVRDHGARLQIAGIADAPQLIAQARAVGADAGQRLLQRKTAGIYQGAHHVRLVANAFLVGEGGHRDGAFRQRPGLAKRTQHGQPRQHSVAAIQGPGVGHAVDVRADHQGRLVTLAACGAQGAEDVADAIEANLQFQLAHPGDQLVAARLLGIGERDARPSAVDGVDANPAKNVNLLQQDRAVQTQLRQLAHRFSAAIRMREGSASGRTLVVDV